MVRHYKCIPAIDGRLRECSPDFYKIIKNNNLESKKKYK